MEPVLLGLKSRLVVQMMTSFNSNVACLRTAWIHGRFSQFVKACHHFLYPLIRSSSACRSVCSVVRLQTSNDRADSEAANGPKCVSCDGNY
jgi:hypothetical protein